MCRAKSALHPEGIRCNGCTGLRALTYTEGVLRQSYSKYTATLAESTETVLDEAGERMISPALLQRIYAAAVAVHKRFVRLQKQRVAVRAARAADEAVRIEAIQDTEAKKEALAKEARIIKAQRALDTASDALVVAQIDAAELQNDDFPGAEERRRLLIKQAQSAATKAIAARAKIRVDVTMEGGLSASQEKRLAGIYRAEKIAVEYLNFIEESVDRAPTAADARRNLAQARGAWDAAEAALIQAEES